MEAGDREQQEMGVPGFTPLCEPGVLDGGDREWKFFKARHESLATLLWPEWAQELKEGGVMNIGTLFSGALDGFATCGEMIGVAKLLARADSDERVQEQWRKRPRKNMMSWGDIDGISERDKKIVLAKLDALLVSPPCKDWSMAGMMLRTDSVSGCWLVGWADKILPYGRPPFLLMEFIYSANDPRFLEALERLVKKLRHKYRYEVGEPKECVLNAAEHGGEDRVRLVLPARAEEVGGKHPVCLLRLPDGAEHPQSVMADWLVPRAQRDERREFAGRVSWHTWAVEQEKKGVRGPRQLTVGSVPPGGLGRRVMSPFHAWPTIRATVFESVARQPMGPSEAFVDPRSGKVVLPESSEVMNIRGYPRQVGQGAKGKPWSWGKTMSFMGRGIGAEHAVTGIISLLRMRVGTSAEPKEMSKTLVTFAEEVRRRGRRDAGRASEVSDAGYKSDASLSARSEMSMDGREHVQKLVMDRDQVNRLTIGGNLVVEDGWPEGTVPFLSPLQYRIIAAHGVELKRGKKGRRVQEFQQILSSATKYGRRVTVEAVPVVGEAVDMEVCEAPKRQSREDDYAELASRLKLKEDEVRVEMVGKTPKLMELLREVQFSESVPGEGEPDGTEEEPPPGMSLQMLPDMNHVADLAPLPEPGPPLEWTGGRVTLRDLVPAEEDRERIAGFMNSAHSAAKDAWDHCLALRRNPAAKPKRGARVHPVMVTGIPQKFRGWKWDTSDPEDCVPIHRKHQFHPQLDADRFEEMCSRWKLRDHRLISMLQYGVTSMADTRPYAIVLNHNYASLAQYYDQVVAKVDVEVSSGKVIGLPVPKPSGGFHSENIRLPFVPMGADSTGTATKSTDLNYPKKARRTTGKNSPESQPEYGLNAHADVENSWNKLRLPTVKAHAKCAAILQVPAKIIGEGLVIMAADFSDFYGQFYSRVDELVHSVFHLVDEDGQMRWLTSRVMQFGGSFGPAVGQGFMECLVEITRQEFDLTEQSKIESLMSRHEGFRAWVDGRRALAKSIVEVEVARMDQARFALQDKSAFIAARERVVTREQTRLYALCGYIDDMHGVAVGAMRGFRLLVTFLRLGLEVSAVFAPKKLGFGHRLQELGVIEDVARMVLVIPKVKREVLAATLGQMALAKTWGREDFVSTVHSLVNLTCVIIVGRTKLGRFFQLMTAKWGRASSRRGNRIMLGVAIKADIKWWIEKLQHSSGCGMMVPQARPHPTLSMESDACREVGAKVPSGVGGFLPMGKGYFWKEQFSELVVKWLHITQLEFYGTLQNVAVFGPLLRDCEVFDDCDNSGTCWVINTQHTSDPVLLELLIMRNELLAQFNMSTVARHFPGWLNEITDALSRSKPDSFKSAVEARGFQFVDLEELKPDESLRKLLNSLACMVRDHSLA